MQDKDSYSPQPDKVADAYHRIKSALYRHRHPPGVFLNIRALAAKMNVSATPVREALIRLADEEIVGFARGRGYVAKALDLEELAGDYEMALIMGRYAIECGTGFWLENTKSQRLEAKSERGLDETQASIAASYIESFYDHLAIRSANVRLIRNMRQFSDRTTHIRQFGLMAAPPFFSVMSELRRLEDALLGGDRNLAADLLEGLIRRKIGGLHDLVKELNLRAQQSRTPLEDLL